ncbi:S-layer homology domain-containing protein [Gorillibacterium massiliense]|uniref:S-layer homology domain-containing protein n=1 Tax=Gorillibacterium massiliense TaxID=1280390 RepID=UPI0004B35EE5|nr:S-layer homology domain-containing protein [Gorillibacterium massiliense]
MNRITGLTTKAALAFALLTGAVALPQASYIHAEQSAAGLSWTVKAATQFPDVKATHWAAKEITKMTMLSVISGENGYFKPDVDVSHQHLLVMAVKMMGLADEAASVDTSSYQLPFGVDESLKGYVVTALNHGLIKLSEIKTGDAGWGKAPGSREWVAQIVVRVANKEPDAAQKNYTNTSFKDGSSVSEAYKGYMNEVIDLGIVSGFEDNTLRPQTAVSRAQAAIMLSKAGDLLNPQPGNPSTGTVLSNDGYTLKLMTDAGETLSLQLVPETQAYNGKTSISATAVIAGNLIKVVSQQSKAYFIDVVQTQGPVVAEGVGFVASVQPDSKKLSMTVGTSSVQFDVTNTAWETIKNVQTGDKLSYQTYGSKIVSARIIPVVKGELTAIDLKGNSKYGPNITIFNTGKPPQMILLASNVLITSPTKANAQATDLFVGDQLVIELNDNGDAAKIDVSLSNVSTQYLATITQDFDKDYKYLTVQNKDGEPEIYKLDDRTVFSDGSGNETPFSTNPYIFTALTRNRKVDLTVSGKLVLKIAFANAYSGKVTFFNRTTGELTLPLADKTLISFSVKAGATVTKTDNKAGALTDIVVGNSVQVTVSPVVVTGQSNNAVYQVKLLP